MKIKNIILLSVSVLSLCYCKKDDEGSSYTVDDIVYTNSQAAVYFHTMFREAENAWAIVDSIKYSTDPYEEKNGSAYKKITFKETEAQISVTVEYNAWMSGTFLLGGSMTIILPGKFYRVKDKAANVTLNSFSINGQRVIGTATLMYRVVEGNEKNDHYDYSLADAAIYHAKESPAQRLITAGITNGKYERIGGGATVKQNDDIWSYTATMKGLLYDDPNMAYTNTILSTQEYELIKGDKLTGIVNFSFSCKTAQKGMSQVVISGWPDMIYVYNCDGVVYLAQTDIL